MNKLLTLILAGMFATGVAIANEDKYEFSKLDKDGDGQLSRTEVAQNSELAAQFSTLDADGDGYLAETEVKSTEEMQLQDAGAEDEDEPESETGEDY